MLSPPVAAQLPRIDGANDGHEAAGNTQHQDKDRENNFDGDVLFQISIEEMAKIENCWCSMEGKFSGVWKTLKIHSGGNWLAEEVPMGICYVENDVLALAN